MAVQKKSVAFGNKNFGYAVANATGDAFEAPKMVSGLVETSNESEEESEKIPADDLSNFLVLSSGSSRKVTVSLYNTMQEYLVDAFGRKKTTAGGLVDSGVKRNHCIFWMDTITDENGKQYPRLTYFYSVDAGDPKVETKTLGDKTEATVYETEYSAGPSQLALDSDGKPVCMYQLVRTEENATLFDQWNTKIILPTDTVA